jgi:hypothetical protein
MYRGSRKHVLDWVSRPEFFGELLETVAPVRCTRLAESEWMPRGLEAPAEARLDAFGPKVDPSNPAWSALTSWWLAHPAGANTPNWDIAAWCEVEGRPGLILVEAKANVPELSSAGKPLANKASAKSKENHLRIGEAIGQAAAGLSAQFPGIKISHDGHYQLSNRLAFAWKLASLGIPSVLVYLGFTGDNGIRDVGEPFAHDDHWQHTFRDHLQTVCPTSVLAAPVDVGSASFWVLSRSRPIIEVSPPRP